MLGRKILGIVRLVLLGIITFPYFLISLVVRPDRRKDKMLGARLISSWCQVIVPLMGFSVRSVNKLPSGSPYLFVSNHRSSLDPLILLANVAAYPVSKADVSTYPMVGKGALRAGVIFVEKKNRSSRAATKEAIHAALKAGKSVLIFPEGRTHAEEKTVTFQKGAYDQAADLNVPVVPIALDYRYKSDCWDHKETMVQHYFRNLAKWRTPVSVRYGSPIRSDNSFTLLRQSQAWIDETISDLREQW